MITSVRQVSTANVLTSNDWQLIKPLDHGVARYSSVAVPVSTVLIQHQMGSDRSNLRRMLEFFVSENAATLEIHSLQLFVSSDCSQPDTRITRYFKQSKRRKCSKFMSPQSLKCEEVVKAGAGIRFVAVYGISSKDMADALMEVEDDSAAFLFLSHKRPGNEIAGGESLCQALLLNAFGCDDANFRISWKDLAVSFAARGSVPIRVTSSDRDIAIDFFALDVRFRL